MLSFKNLSAGIEDFHCPLRRSVTFVRSPPRLQSYYSRKKYQRPWDSQPMELVFLFPSIVKASFLSPCPFQSKSILKKKAILPPSHLQVLAIYLFICLLGVLKLFLTSFRAKSNNSSPSHSSRTEP